MSCQSLAPARAFPAPSPAPSADEKDPMAACGAFHRSVRFSSESQSSYRGSTDAECRRDTPGSISLTALTVTSVSSNTQASYSSMSQSAPTASVTFGDLNDLVAPSLPNSGCRFPKLEECAHFHYERVSLGGLRVELVKGQECEASTTHCSDDSTADSEVAEGWVCLRVQSHVNESSSAAPEPAGCALNSSFPPSAAEWNLTRNADNFRMLDNMLHRCIYDRKVSGLSDLSVELTMQVAEDRAAYESLVSDYLHHFSIIADDTINCGSVLNWLQMDNRGHRLLVANEDSSSINTPAVAAAYSVRKYVSQARDEISFEVGDMISIIDMPGPQESLWWRGKRGFRVGFFPHHCVAVIGDKVPRHMTQPPPIVGSVAVAPIKPVLRKHGKLISLFRSFILSRPSRRSLKQQGILRERVFGCDLGEHLLNSAHDVPLVLVESASVIEAHGIVDGIYRLSGGSGLTQRLRAAFDEGRAPPDLSAPPVLQDIHAVASLLKMYFRELPNPLCTYQLYEGFVGAVQPAPDEQTRLRRMRETVVKLPPPHYRTLSYLMRHLRRVSLLGAATGMTARNMAIVWAPNLLRSPRSQHALQGVAVQAVVTEFLICYAEELFAEDQGEESAPSSLEHVELRHGSENTRRPKSLPLNTPTKLLSLEEARQRGGHTSMAPGTMALPPPSGAIAAAANTQLRPASHKEPKYIEVGSGPNNLPQYHTVIERPAQGGPKRGLKRSPSGWRGLFFRSKQQRPPGGISALSIEHPVVTTDTQTQSCSQLGRLPAEIKDVTMSGSPLRPVKSCESLQSETDLVGPLSAVGSQSLANSKQHTRSASCDSYFEPWQAELADMRLRLSPQERDGNIFSEEDDTTLNIANNFQSICSTPLVSGGCSVEPSPRRGPVEEAVDRKRSKLEEQLNSISYIDGTDSPVRHKPSPEKRHSDEWLAHSVHNDDSKRLCKDRDSPQESLADGFQSSIAGVKLRERNSPRKSKGASRYSGLHQPLTNLPNDVPTDTKIITIVNQIGPNNRVTWHGAKDNHSTLIKIDWPVENLSVNSLTASTLLSSPLTPVTPVYDPLESDSDRSENRQMIKIEECVNCGQTKCLKCELMDAKTRSSEMNETLIQNENLTEIESKVGKDYENVRKADFKVGKRVSEFEMTLTADEKIEHDSLESTPVHSTNISYQNLNRLSNISTNSSNSEPKDNAYENVTVERSVEKKTVLESQKSVMSSSHESSSSYSNISPVRLADELYECFSFNRPNYINLQSSGSSKSSMSPLKSPLKSTISITFKSPTKVSNEYESVETPTNTFETHMNNETPKSFESPPNGFHYENFKNEAVTPVNIVESPKNCYENTKSYFEITKFQNERDSVYEDIDLDKNLSIVEEASVPDVDASLPTDQACQPDSFNEDLIILESPIEQPINDEQDRIVDIYSQVKFFRKSIEEVNAMILESPEDKHEKGTVREVEECPKNSHESPKNSASETLSVHYENIDFPKKSDQPCVDSTKNDMTLEISEQALCLDRRVLEDKIDITKIDLKANEVIKMRVDESATQPKLSLAMPLTTIEHENGNQVLKKPQAKNLNVRQLANRFESPTEQKGPFNFKTEVKYPTLERKKEPVSSIDRAKSLCEARPKKELSLKLPPPVSPKTFQLSKNSVNARSLDENAFAIEFGCDKRYSERRKSLEVRESKKNTKYLPDLNLNTEEVENESQENISITPTTENKISLIQRFSTKDCKTSPEGSKSLLNFEVSKKLSRERIEKYKEERRNFLREKYSSQSFRSASPAEHLTRLKMKKQDENEKPSDLEKLDTVELRHPEKYERLFEKESDTLPKFERRNTVDLGQRMRFSLNRSANNLDNLMMASRSKDHEVPGKMGKKERDAGLFVREREGAARSSAPTGHPERKDKMSPSYNIKDMAAMFEQKSQHNAG